ncbi:B12-binding domain-containing radical SAM protein [Rhizobium rhizogenes]|uniref:B12-binding domain-containing radical SAM protein n=1 Tax=Rhizobium rhizogenes TaxID=359 RepID=UPI0015736A66|nr:radical SAM protein [Rhizobium rhizogenes]NTF72692.1 radical SAM protein [Rhizobium rhizogenes]
MTILLISGMGPEFPDNRLLRGSSFELLINPEMAAVGSGRARFDLSRLQYKADDGGVVPLLRARRDGGGARAMSNSSAAKGASQPARTFHLTTFTLQSILAEGGVEFDAMPTENIWKGVGDEPAGSYDVVLLSTTFIWDRRSLLQAISWIELRFPDAILILGGQYSNLKFMQIMRDHGSVDFIIRGDAEFALPDLLNKLKGGDPTSVPNLVFRDVNGRTRLTPIAYIDLDQYPSPALTGHAPVVPYESMRGCPFSCKFCSFPAASPLWRYKSADKIASDWEHYKVQNGASYVKALDSTFTVPPKRLRELLPKLATIDIQWEAYTRANSIKDAELVHQLEDAGCKSLFIGFESMSDASLRNMDKKVTARANRVAHELLDGSTIKHFVSFIVGYPGETPDMFEETKAYLVNEYSGEFALYVCMLQDETMPVWQDAERFNLQVDDPSGEARIWSHIGMDSDTAQRLQLETLREVRWKSDTANFRSWQHDFEGPLISNDSGRRNAVVEKLVDRLGMISADVEDEGQAQRLESQLLEQLNGYGVTTA